jgi:hypothetical protein
MVAFKKYKSHLLLIVPERKQIRNHFPRIRTPVDIVSEKYHIVAARERQSLDQPE